MNTSFILAAILAIRDAIITHETELESLDRAIGDGDHYINMKRGSEVIAGMSAELSPLPPADVLQKIGFKLLSTIGGASGPLFASFFMSMSKTAKDLQAESVAQIAACFAAGVDAIRQRGKADVGEKTMLDVLIPVANRFTELSAQGAPLKDLLHALQLEAEKGLQSTGNMLATKGRAAFLGERAIGHLDPGAKSCQIMIEVVCNLALKDLAP